MMSAHFSRANRCMKPSFDGRPVRLQLESGDIVLIDPVALDGRRGNLPKSE